jgi:hypothetical protein
VSGEHAPKSGGELVHRVFRFIGADVWYVGAVLGIRFSH